MTACNIATSIVHCKLDYCNSLYYNLLKFQITALQLIQNSLDPAVVTAPKSCHITPILRCLHWLKITKHIEYKLLSLTKSSQPHNLHIFTTLSLFILLAALALDLSLTSLNRSTTNMLWDRFTSLGHPCKFQRLSRLGSSQVVGVSQTLRRWTEGATYVWQVDHHIGHWPTFQLSLFCKFNLSLI